MLYIFKMWFAEWEREGRMEGGSGKTKKWWKGEQALLVLQHDDQSNEGTDIPQEPFTLLTTTGNGN